LRPTLKRMFLPAAEVNRTIQARSRRSTVGAVWFGHLQTPGGSRTFPILYLEALLRGTVGTLNERTVRAFNASPAARTALDEAKTEFERRIVERQKLSPFDRLLTLDDVSWLINVGPQPIARWCDNGKLPYVTTNERRLIQPDDLRSRCTWVLRTR
jgi:hypothetical protein